MESVKKHSKSSENVLKNMIAEEPKEGLYGIIIPLEDSNMILKSSKFSIMESYPDLKSAEPTFTLRINLEEEDIPIFEKIEKQLASIAMKNKERVKILSQTPSNNDPEIDFKNASKYDESSFKLIRENGEVWAKLYHNQRTLEITAPFWRLIGNKRRRVKNPNSLIGSEMEGLISLELKQIFMAKHKAIKENQFLLLMSSQKKKKVEKIFVKIHIFNKNMSLKVSYVKGMPFVKVPVQCHFTIPECTCKIFNGQFGVSAAVFLNESPPSVKEQVENIELFIKRLATKKQPIIEELLDEDFESQVEKLKLIKNGILWGKTDFFPTSHSKMMASVVFRINHIFFSAQRVSISCNIVSIFK